MNLKIKMLQNFLALKYILFYFVNLIGQNSVGQKWQKICLIGILPFSDVFRNFLGMLFS